MKIMRKGKLAASITAVIALLAGGMTAVAYATDLSAGVSNLKVEKLDGTDSQISQYETIKFSGNWSTGSSAASVGDTFSILMPEELAFNTVMDFQLKKVQQSLLTVQQTQERTRYLRVLLETLLKHLVQPQVISG